jgi:hypothetical protein
VVGAVFQNIFCSKMYQNNDLLFLKNYFWHQHTKTIWKHQKQKFEVKKKIKKNSIFFKKLLKCKKKKNSRPSISKVSIFGTDYHKEEVDWE